MNFEYVENIATADVAIRAYGKTLEEAFANVSLGMLNVITDVKKIKQKTGKTIEIKSENLKSLLYDWLQELIFLWDTKFLIFSKFKIMIRKENGKYFLNAKCFGEKIDPKKQKLKQNIKAVTYHMMEIKEKNGKFSVQVILDL
jgi:SHS2 domain-containing protein